MNYKKIAAIAAVLTMMTSAVSCGHESKENESVEATSAVSVEGTTVSGEKATGSGTTTTSKKSSKTTAEATEKSSGSTTTEKAASGTTTNGSSSGEKSGGSSGGSSSGSSGSSGSDSNSGGSSSGESSGSGSGESTEEEVKVYTAEITLGSTPKVTGSNVTVNGTVVTITAGGDYIFTGSVNNGQICVDTGASEDKVTVVLNGVDISNSSAPAIFIAEAKRCTIKPKENSVNYLESGVEKKGIKDTGAIFSNDTIRLKGNGELNITATESHGINADDDVIIESGTYNIESRKSGIIANDDVTINDGKINVKGGTNGIKSKGTININGGQTFVSGGTKEEKSSLYAEAALNYTGGYLYAAGNQVTKPATTANPYIVVSIPKIAKANNEIAFYLNGSQKASFVPHNDYRCALMLSPDIKDGSTFYATIGGTKSEEFTVSGSENIFKVE